MEIVSSRETDAVTGHFAENTKSGNIGNPVEIEQGIVALVELEQDKKPLRRRSARMSRYVQTGLLNAFHLRVRARALQPKNV